MRRWNDFNKFFGVNAHDVRNFPESDNSDS